jgi:UDP-galactose transporter B1
VQEKLTSSKTVYRADAGGSSVKWSYPIALNAGMAFAACATAFLFEKLVMKSKNKVSYKHFWKAALTSAMASPLGYASLSFISFPLMILTKSCKPIPVMVIGFFRYAVKYPWYKYVSVALLSSGIGLFCAFQPPKGGTSSSSGSSSSEEAWFDLAIPFTGVSIALPVLAVGIVLVLGNLTLDGFTNNEQDYLFSKFKASSIQMMGNVNLWQTIYLLGYLVVMHPFQQNSEIVGAVSSAMSSSALRFDLGMFFLCASVGQLLIFTVMEEFGSLTWVTIGITRKMFTILLSVIIYKHKFNVYMWGGVGLVFAGMGLEVFMKYADKPAAAKKKSN